MSGKKPTCEDIDCTALGMKCGLEIHQQLDTDKLFCRCPSKVRDDEPHIEVKRRLRAVAGETGELDEAASQETKKEKYYLYQAYHDTTCQVELDEEPPHPMNKEALKIVLQVCKMIQAKIVDEIQIMRKTVVDGSNTSGFQRTALVGMDGILKTDCGDVTVPAICIEEDAAKIIEHKSDHDIFNLSKLGIPLIEIGTGPDITSPEMALDVAQKIGMILRSTKKVKRGIGTIRQDVNISIKGGNRIEIKGAQELRLIPDWIKNECKRQRSLLEIREILKVKGTKNEMKDEKIDITEIFKDSDSKIIKSTLDKKGIILAIKLPGFAGLIGTEVQPGRRLGTEFSDYAKVAAGVGGIFHSDELPNYGITDDDVTKITKELKCKEHDGFALVCAKENQARKALEAVFKRAMLCFEGVVMEVRKPKPDGTSSYMRPIPGAARMYPETDCLPIIPDTEKITIPRLITEEIKDIIKKYKLSEDLGNALFKKDSLGLGYLDIFSESSERFKNLKPAFIAENLVAIIPEIMRKFVDDKKVDVQRITKENFMKTFEMMDSGKVSKESMMDIMVDIAREGKVDFSKYSLMDESKLKEEIQKIIDENKGMPFNALIGKVMGKLRGKADGKLISQLLKEMSN